MLRRGPREVYRVYGEEEFPETDVWAQEPQAETVPAGKEGLAATDAWAREQQAEAGRAHRERELRVRWPHRLAAATALLVGVLVLAALILDLTRSTARQIHKQTVAARAERRRESALARAGSPEEGVHFVGHRALHAVKYRVAQAYRVAQEHRVAQARRTGMRPGQSAMTASLFTRTLSPRGTSSPAASPARLSVLPVSPAAPIAMTWASAPEFGFER
jgi:hypothetical protein